MTSPTRTRTRKVLSALAVLFLIFPLAAFFLIDVEDFRGLIENRLEKTLGRDVRLGEMELSIWPVFGVRLGDVALAALEEEGGGDLITAQSLRVGAKLGPLLSGQLEVTSLLVEEPSLRLERDAAGTWNMERLVVSSPPEGATPPGAAPADVTSSEPLTIETLRVSGGRIEWSDASLADTPLELLFEDFELELRGFGSQSMHFTTTARLGESARVESQGTFRSADDLELTLRLADAPSALIARFAAVSGWNPQDALGDSTWGFDTNIKVQGGVTELSETLITGADLHLKRRQGSWNLLSTNTSPTSPSDSGSSLVMNGITVRESRLRIRDEDAQPPIELSAEALNLRIEEVLDDGPRNLIVEGPLRVLQGDLDLQFALLSLELDRVPDAEQAAQIIATAQLQNSVATLDVRGKIGPIPRQGDPKADLQIRAESWPLERLRPVLSNFTQGTASLNAALAGNVPGRFDLRGELTLQKAQLADSELEPLDLGAQFDLGIQNAGERVELRQVDADLGSKLNGIRGNIERRNEDWRLDLTLPPNEISADGFLALAALAGSDPGIALEAKAPLQIEARIVGFVGESSTPTVTGKMNVEGLTADLGLREPLREIHADLVFDGERVRSESLSMRFGPTDLSGQIEVLLTEPPQLTVDLRSQQADFAELLRLSESKEATSQNGTDIGNDPGPQAQEAFRAEGRLRVANGTWDTLDFQELDARFRLAEGSLTLDPVTMNLYDGTFQGELGSRLDTEPVAFDLDGRVEGIDLEAFLADNLDAGGTVRGKFTGELSTAGLSADATDVLIRSLKGGGKMHITDGGIPKLDLLSTISRISGVLGQHTVAELTDELARDGTRFESLDAGFELAGGGLGLGELSMVSPLFSLQGQGMVDLLAGHLDIQAELAFGQKISTWMREENSRAAELFWDAQRQRVVLPLVLDGSFDAPRGTVDWESAARGVIVRSAEKKLSELLGGFLGKKNPPPTAQQPTAQQPTAQQPTAQQPTENSPEISTEPQIAQDGDLTVTIDQTRWRGSGLAQDLRIEGTAQGDDLRRATLIITDAAGRELERTDITTLREQIFAGSDATDKALTWSVEIEGKRLLRAQFPLTARVLLETHSGKILAVERAVNEATKSP